MQPLKKRKLKLQCQESKDLLFPQKRVNMQLIATAHLIEAAIMCIYEIVSRIRVT
jgi:hypothetical protein